MDKILSLILFVIFCLAGPGYAAFELQETGAGNTAMAGAVSSIVRDASSLLYNPAGLGLAQERELLLTQFNPYGWDLLACGSAVYVQPFRKQGSLALSASYLGTLEDKDYKSQLDYSEVVIMVGYGTRLDFFERSSAGIALKYLSTRSGQSDSTGFGLGFGFLYEMRNKINLALTGKDISLGRINYSTGASEALNPMVKLGISADLLKNFTPSLDLGMRIRGAVDPFQAGLGLQYAYRFLSIRAGFLYTGQEMFSLSTGLGVRIPYLKGISADYAFVYHTGLDYSNMFSVSLKF
ncbi:MAG: hypothetical protein PHF84_09145 [bacterium]|nr:hypothetical protein [bacterium]